MIPEAMASRLQMGGKINVNDSCLTRLCTSCQHVRLHDDASGGGEDDEVVMTAISWGKLVARD
eukprot:5891726-Amphidinium_carterae.1